MYANYNYHWLHHTESISNMFLWFICSNYNGGSFINKLHFAQFMGTTFHRTIQQSICQHSMPELTSKLSAAIQNCTDKHHQYFHPPPPFHVPLLIVIKLFQAPPFHFPLLIVIKLFQASEFEFFCPPRLRN